MSRDEEAPVFGARGATENLIPRAGFILAGNHPEGDPRTGLEQTLRLFSFAEDLGYDVAGIRQRHLERGISSALPFLAAASQRTQRDPPRDRRRATRVRDAVPAGRGLRHRRRPLGRPGQRRDQHVVTARRPARRPRPRQMAPPIRTSSSSDSSRRWRADRSPTSRCTPHTDRRSRGSSRTSPGCAIASGSAAARSDRCAGPPGTGSSCCSAT